MFNPDMSWLPGMLQTTDSIFPTGSYAHSFGLEGLVQLGVITDARSLDRTVSEQIIPALRHFEMPFVRLSYNAVSEQGRERLLILDERYGAMKGSREMRLASKRIGSQRLLMVQKILPNDLLQGLLDAREFQGHATIVLGLTGALGNIPLKAVLMGCFYQTLAGLIVAALKILRMGQEAGQKLLAGWLEGAQGAVAASLAVEECDIGWFQPMIDIASARHETAYTRLFIS